MAADLKPQFVARAEKQARVAEPAVTHFEMNRRERLAARSGENVREKQARLSEQAVTHFEKNRRQWIASRYGKLLRQEAPGPELKPAGMGEDRAGRLMRAATHLVERKQTLRLDRIRSAGERLASGRTSNQIGR
ncbi:MAG TPA: hypothetical protein VK614_02300 [Allosphingosinicella sp.]|nr:hypothetical protein [Allosphingosinicella sp.]